MRKDPTFVTKPVKIVMAPEAVLFKQATKIFSANVPPETVQPVIAMGLPLRVKAVVLTHVILATHAVQLLPPRFLPVKLAQVAEVAMVALVVQLQELRV